MSAFCPHGYLVTNGLGMGKCPECLPRHQPQQAASPSGPDPMDAKIAELRSSGKTCREISELTGRSERAVKLRLGILKLRERQQASSP